MVALEEKRLPYELVGESLPIEVARRAELAAAAVIGRIPLLVDGAVALTESLAISEYLAEAYPYPDHPRLFPADLAERARARQIMSAVRTSMFALRDERPTTSVFDAPLATPLTPKARAEADELIRIADRVVTGETSMFATWCIADVDLGLALLRLVKNGDPVPPRLAAYAEAQWDRPSVRAYVGRGRQAG
jgi:glutathione S-transferase